MSENHRVYLNLESKRFYCLPDNYEIIDPSLSDIIYVLNPTFTSKVGAFTPPLIFSEAGLGLSRGAPSRVKTLREITKLAKTELVHKFRESGKMANSPKSEGPYRRQNL